MPSVAFEAATRSSILSGEALERIHLVVGGMRLNPERMHSNLTLSGGMISGEAIIRAFVRDTAQPGNHNGR